MYFEDLPSLLQMDGHGAYVWAAYAITLLVLVILLLLPKRRQSRLLREIGGELRRNSATATGRGGN